jgi:hypothetical protein
MRHIKDGQNYYHIFKAGSTERCQTQLATALLSLYLIVLGLTSLKNSLRKDLNKNHRPNALKKRFYKHTYVRMEKAEKRNKGGKNYFSKWKPQVGNLVLAKCQAVSDAVDGITKKFVRPYDGPWKVTRVINPPTYEVANEQGKITMVTRKQLNLICRLMNKKIRRSCNGERMSQVIPCLCIILGLCSCYFFFIV